MPPTTSWSRTRRSFPTKIRNQILKQQPTCNLCGINPSTDADHITPHHILARQGLNPDTLDNAQALCRTCHNTKTQAEINAARTPPTSRKRKQPPHPGLLPGG